MKESNKDEHTQTNTHKIQIHTCTHRDTYTITLFSISILQVSLARTISLPQFTKLLLQRNVLCTVKARFTPTSWASLCIFNFY